ncbi:uncharacterized protein LOC103505281 [Diaphorina citri]|uniref:Uncharacterized protein LOC103505281 n=1 Tax=Diaphorina citri TaxID=121845 RepID=A0A1S3CVF6_DIACI|nr:uncharacterized protein LOC103505281 [Diaphorina citri]
MLSNLDRLISWLNNRVPETLFVLVVLLNVLCVVARIWRGEYSVKDNEEPKGKLVKSEYKFNKASAEDKGKSESKTTTAVLNAKNIKYTWVVKFMWVGHPVYAIQNVINIQGGK